jgi:hypothetical protein
LLNRNIPPVTEANSPSLRREFECSIPCLINKRTWLRHADLAIHPFAKPLSDFHRVIQSTDFDSLDAEFESERATHTPAHNFLQFVATSKRFNGLAVSGFQRVTDLMF